MGSEEIRFGKAKEKTAAIAAACALIIIIVFAVTPEDSKDAIVSIVAVLATATGMFSFALAFMEFHPQIDGIMALAVIAMLGNSLEGFGGAFKGIEVAAFWYAAAAMVVWVVRCATEFNRNPKGFVDGKLREITVNLGLVKREITIGEKLAELNTRSTHPLEGFGWSKWQELMAKEHRRNEYEWNGIGGSFGIDPLEEANPHINISGVSGYGKSTLCKVIAKGIWEAYKLPTVILDLHNEYGPLIHAIGGTVLDPSKASLGIWELEDETPAQKISENTGIFEHVLELGDIQAYFLSKVAEKAYNDKKIPLEKTIALEQSTSMKDIIEAADKWLRKERRPDKSLISLRRRLSMLELAGVFSAKTSVPFSELLSRPTCIKLGSLRSVQAQTLYAEVFLRKLYNYMLKTGKTNNVRLFVLIDEAQNVCKAGKEGGSFAGKITAEARKYGIGLITSNQMAQDLDKTIIANSAISFAFYQKEPHETNYIIELMTGPDYEKKIALNKRLCELQKFECICITTKQRKPTLIKIRPLPLTKQATEKLEAEHEMKLGSGQTQTQGVVREMTEKKARKTTDKENAIEMITRALEERKIEFVRHHTKQKPDLEIRKNGKRIAVKLESEKKRPNKLKTQGTTNL